MANSAENSSLESFTLKVSDKDLEATLELARASLLAQRTIAKHEQVPPAPSDYTGGLDSKTVDDLCTYFTSKYDWRTQEANFMNMGQHYRARIEDVPGEGPMSVYFVHAPSKAPDAIPLLLAHGWPGSVFEFKDLIPLLTDPPQDQQAFHVVCPSLLGYTFSQGTQKSVTQVEQIAFCSDKIMSMLGYSKYVTQGGDWGSRVARQLARAHEGCVALHINYFSFDPTHVKPSSNASDSEKRGHERYASFRAKGSAYSFMQGTTPYTLGSVLSTSPLAALIYIGEKFYRWTAPESRQDTDKFMDDLITNVMLYWFSGSITSAFMLYYNTLCGGDVLEVDAAVLDKPAAFTCGHYELGWTPEYYFREKHTNTRFHEVVNERGHFFAMEQPAFLAKAIRKHFAQDDIRGLL